MAGRKGNGGEIEVARLVKDWWSKLEPECRFVRTPSSGGWMHGDGFDMCGDLMTNARFWPFCVEVKRRERWSLKMMIECKPSPVWSWWRQCQRDASKVDREPMLWMRKNRQPWFVMLRYDYATSLRGMRAPDVVWPKGLKLKVDCQAVPALYMATNLTELDPSVFARTVATD